MISCTHLRESVSIVQCSIVGVLLSFTFTQFVPYRRTSNPRASITSVMWPTYALWAPDWNDSTQRTFEKILTLRYISLPDAAPTTATFQSMVMGAS